DILMLVSASFSLAASAFFPAMVLGIFWPRTTRTAAITGMLTGLSVTVFYMLANAGVVRTALGLGGSGLWWGIQPVSAGVFGVPAGALVVWAVSWVTSSDRSMALGDRQPV
ncbi:MAG: cation acetate symporter, partial [Rhodoferax sp.]|nr:cation acetate symporter [Rhodoferax sp.]